MWSGGWLLRPLLAVTGPVLRHYARPHLTEARRAIEASTGWSDDTLRIAFGSAPSPQEMADTLLDVALVLLRQGDPDPRSNG